MNCKSKMFTVNNHVQLAKSHRESTFQQVVSLADPILHEVDKGIFGMSQTSMYIKCSAKKLTLKVSHNNFAALWWLSVISIAI